MQCKTQTRCESASLMLAFISMVVVSTVGHTLLRPAVVERVDDFFEWHTAVVWLLGVAVGGAVRWGACKHISVRRPATQP